MAGATQVKFVVLAEGDAELAVQLESVWHLAAKRKTGQASFKIELFIYVQKVAARSTIRRATEGRIAVATALIDNQLRSQPEAESLGEASPA
ncbi:hypothetical protein PR002_g32582 [Phytophthora rubi]|uniref:Uncharacterized protein n=1 Tax=Phytophthora rubi TaxID=129364 RepID=A0A6A3G7D1_9STRA|nr:hypothetical protein PR002_g32582 [Phytophthora rubi]